MSNHLGNDAEKEQRRNNGIKFTASIYPNEVMTDSSANFIWKESVFHMREMQKRCNLSGLQ